MYHLVLIHSDKDCSEMQMKYQLNVKVSISLVYFSFLLFHHIYFSGYLFSLTIRACVYVYLVLFHLFFLF